MLRICTHCGKEKELEKFVKQGHLYRYRCKDCLNSSLRTGKIHTGRFKKGHNGGKRFEKGHQGGNQFAKGLTPWNKGKNNVYSEETLKKISESGKGRKHTEEAKIKIAIGARRGKDRQSWAFKNWRKQVFERDNFTCKTCGCIEKEKLHPHHIIRWAECEEKRFDIDNGMTLCRSCHGKLEGFQPGEQRAKKRINNDSFKYSSD